MRSLFVALSLAALADTAALGAQSPDTSTRPRSSAVVRVLRATRAVRPPLLDGKLSETAWATAEIASDFTQKEPTPGAPASERTEARVLYDDAAIYVGMRMYDSQPDSIRAQLVRRDEGGAASDWASVFLDSYHDRRTGYHFGVTPRGSRLDMLHSEDTRADFNWDAVWEVATSIDSLGWTAEFRIPLSQLRYTVGGTGRWGIQFSREIARRSELAHWRVNPPTEAGFVSLFGELIGLNDLIAPARLEVAPYTVGRVTREPGLKSDPFWRRTATYGAAGADLKYGLASALTLTATLNPDFGQVEADASVVNLGSFETFFPEKRPFFTEGSEIFSFPMAPEGQVFYSRRIGRPPQRGVSVPENGYGDLPDVARILGAAKLSGKTAGGWSLGALAALTGEAKARLADSAGRRFTEPLEPRTTYGMTRMVRDFRRGESGVGVVATATLRDLRDARLDTLRKSAYAAGGNFWHRWGGGRFETTGWLLGTSLGGSTASMIETQRNSVHRFQRPDAPHLGVDLNATSLHGWAGEAFLRKISGAWAWFAGGGARSPGADVNDIGFQSYADMWHTTTGASYRNFRAGPRLRNWTATLDGLWAWTFAEEPIRRSYHANLTATFLNFWNGSLDVTRWTSIYWPWELRGGPSLRLPARTQWNSRVGSNRRRPTFVEVSAGGEYKEENDGLYLTISPSLTTRPSSRASLSISPQAGWVREPAQYIVGHLEQRTVALTLRSVWLFTPNVSLDVYAQPFLSGGRYREIKEVASPRAPTFEQRFRVYSPSELTFDARSQRYSVDLQRDGTADFSFANPDFNVRQLNTNAVFRWEYRAGSLLYVVWSHARDEDLRDLGLRVGRDLDRLFSTKPRNVFLVKASYWISR
jgi:hypothetical protein